jgi:branched-chain amino acid aminotransferase
MTLTVSSWRRSGDTQLPYRAKAAANYVVARQARIEASGRGFDDAVLLNDAGRVAEATGSCVVALRDDVVLTPPAYEGALESITLDVVERICHREGLPSSDARWIGQSSSRATRRRWPARSLNSRRSLRSILPGCASTELSIYLRDRYLSAMRRVEPLADVEIECVSVDELRRWG